MNSVIYFYLDRPSRPVNVTFTSCESQSTAVSFTPGSSNNDAILNFTVHARASYGVGIDEDNSYFVAAVVAGNGPFNGIVQLDPWRNYSFYVVAQNSIGTSDASNVTAQRCQTPASVPTVNPSGVCAEQRSSSELVIVWQVGIIRQFLQNRIYLYFLQFIFQGRYENCVLWKTSQLQNNRNARVLMIITITWLFDM